MVKHNCGFCVARTLHDAYSFIKGLQHRGREACGIAFIGDEGIDVIKWVGKVSRFSIEDLYKIFPSEKYHTYLAHVRYATRGRKDKILQDAHPVVVGGTTHNHRETHLIIKDCDAVMVHNGQVDPSYFNEEERRNRTYDVDTELLLRKYLAEGTKRVLEQVPGSYSLAVASKDKKGVLVLRDRHAMKPGVLGWKDGKYLVVSEDVALGENGARYIEDLQPGYQYHLHPQGHYEKTLIIPTRKKQCFFEWNYISNVNSILDGVSVRRLRETLGIQLAKEFNMQADLVTFLPRCPEPAARTYAETRNLPFVDVFYKTRNERSFLGSTEAERKQSITTNLYLLPQIQGVSTEEYLKGKTVILIDDSTIRGNNSRRAIELLKSCGVKDIHFINYTPQIGIIGKDGEPRGCNYGVDMPPNDNFVARGRTANEINERIGAQVYFLSTEGMLEAFKTLGINKEELCYFCIGGKKPF